jgi:TIR domain
MQDLERSEKGLPLKTYDAFVIYNDKDVEFASELIERCESFGYSLCVKDRDLLGGLSFESDAILNLLSKRCNRLIIIISKAFLKSPMQIFITNFAQALGIEQGKRKIIPCLLEPCDLPQMLRFCFRLDYYRNNRLFDFWDKLDKSLKVTTEVKNSNAVEDKRFVVESKFKLFEKFDSGGGLKNYKTRHFWRRLKRYTKLHKIFLKKYLKYQNYESNKENKIF